MTEYVALDTTAFDDIREGDRVTRKMDGLTIIGIADKSPSSLDKYRWETNKGGRVANLASNITLIERPVFEEPDPAKYPVIWGIAIGIPDHADAEGYWIAATDPGYYESSEYIRHAANFKEWYPLSTNPAGEKRVRS